MPCQHYKDALIEVAASDAAPQGELRAHLDECASCRAAFDQEQFLFAAIDSSIHAAVNTEVPPSLLPGVRARLDEVAAPRFRWARSLVFASAGVALAFFVFLLVRPHHTTPENQAKQSPAAAAPDTPQANGKPITEIASSESAELSTADGVVGNVIARRKMVKLPTLLPPAASGNPEILVPSDEREGLAQLVATLNRHGDVAAAFLAQRPEKKDALVTMDPLKISDVEIKPLEGTETETWNGAGERH